MLIQTLISTIFTATLIGTEVQTITPPTEGVVTFNQHIAPILFEQCANCHRPGQSAPFSLLTYRDAKKYARQIAAVTQSRYMPPWLPEPGFGKFAGERRLSNEQIATIKHWVGQGTLEGDTADRPPIPVWTEGWHLGEPDLTIQLSEPFLLESTDTDVFQNFVMPIPVKDRRFVRTIELRTGNPKIVHHLGMVFDQTLSSRRLDEQEPGLGFKGMRTAVNTYLTNGQMLKWLPEKVPNEGTKGMSWPLDRGTDLLLQLHIISSGKSELIQPTVGFFFTEEPPSLFPLTIRIGSQTIDIPPGEKNYMIEDSIKLPVDVDVLSIYPHAHFLGKRLEGFADLPDGTRQWLIRINDWDFHWQDQYRYAEPIALPAGSIVRTRYTYDNSNDNARNPHHPPKRVIYGPQPHNEMGDLWIQLLPRSREDRNILMRAFAIKEQGENIARDQKKLQLNTDDARAYCNLGIALFNQGKSIQAIEHYRQALRLDPDSADTHYNLANTLSHQGQIDGAIQHYGTALRINPQIAEAQYNLAICYQKKNRIDSAINHYRKAIKIDPDYAQAHKNLAIALYSRGTIKTAIKHFRETLSINPDDIETHNNLGAVLQSGGKLNEAIKHYTLALKIDPRNSLAHTSLGTVLQYQGQMDKAIEHFHRVVQIQPDQATGHFNLGTALQSQKRLDEAIKYYREALRLKPDFAQAQNNLAVVLHGQGKLDQAINIYRQLLQKQPHNLSAAKNLGLALRNQGKPVEAISHYRMVVKLKPDDLEGNFGLALALQSTGQLDEAMEYFRRTLLVNPRHVVAHTKLGEALASRGQISPALEHFHEAARIRVDYPTPLHRIAWILSTHPDDKQRDPDKAIRLAERAAALTRSQNPVVLDVLATAYAAAGRFDQAVEIAQAALTIARSSNAEVLAQHIQARQELFRASQPYRVRAENEPTTDP